MHIVSAAVAALIGACVGSFLNVVIHRVPRGESITRPRSRCPRCGTILRARDNVPIVSWVMLRGRCAHCGDPIAGRYPLVELATAALWASAALRFDALEEAVVVALTGSVLLGLAAIDLEHRRLPNLIVLPATIGAVGWTFAFAALTGDWLRFVGSIASGAAAFMVFFVIAFLSGGMGFGDVKLAAFIGVVAGWFDPAVAAAAIFFSFLVGGLIAVVLLVTRRAGRKTAVPFGPSLAAGCLVALFVGVGPVRAYLGY